MISAEEWQCGTDSSTWGDTEETQSYSYMFCGLSSILIRFTFSFPNFSYESAKTWHSLQRPIINSSPWALKREMHGGADPLHSESLFVFSISPYSWWVGNKEWPVFVVKVEGESTSCWCTLMNIWPWTSLTWLWPALRLLMRLQHDYHSCDYKNKFLHFIYMQIFLLSCLLDSSNAESHCMFPPRSIFSTVCIFSFIQAEFACLHSEAVSCREAGLWQDEGVLLSVDINILSSNLYE